MVMAALKSARDQLNRPGEIKLMLIMSGSDRDKLMRLVNTAGAPFFGSRVQPMPELGKDFIEHISVLVEMQRPSLKAVDRDVLLQAFRAFGSRPLEGLRQRVPPLVWKSARGEYSLDDVAMHRWFAQRVTAGTVHHLNADGCGSHDRPHSG